MALNDIRLLADRLRENVGQVIIGKEEVVDLLFIAMVTGGHVLLEDVPGTGKTLLAKSVARWLIVRSNAFNLLRICCRAT